MEVVKRCLAAMMSMFCSTAITIRPAIGAHARLTWVHRVSAAPADRGGLDARRRRWLQDMAAQPPSSSTRPWR